MKTFRDRQYGFEIDLPEGWRVPYTGILAILFGHKLNFNGPSGDNFNIQVGPLDPEPSLKQTRSNFLDYAMHMGFTEVETGTIQVGGKKHFCARYVWGRPARYITKEHATNELVVKKYSLVFRGTEYAITCLLGARPIGERHRFDEKERLYDKVMTSFRLAKT